MNFIKEKTQFINNIEESVKRNEYELEQLSGLFNKLIPLKQISNNPTAPDEIMLQCSVEGSEHQSIQVNDCIFYLIANNFVKSNEKITFAERVRNYVLCSILAISILISFTRTDFLTQILFIRTCRFLRQEWSLRLYLETILILSSSLLFDTYWIFVTCSFEKESIYSKQDPSAQDPKYYLKQSCLYLSFLNVSLKVKVLVFEGSDGKLGVFNDIDVFIKPKTPPRAMGKINCS